MTRPLIGGMATTQGTSRYRERFSGSASPDHFGLAGNLWLSSIGLGTYLGEPDERDDRAYRQATVHAVKNGCNVIDSAVNYRFQRSERTVGEALEQIVARGEFDREEIVIATKGGFIPFDGGFPSDAAGWFRSSILEPGLATESDVVANCHIMTPAYLEAQLGWSLGNLGLETVDIYYVHNPETQLQAVSREVFLDRIARAFEMLEGKVREGKVGIYGVATWDGLRVSPASPGHLSLQDLLAAAERVAGAGHHFRAIQLPINLVMTEACLEQTQRLGGRDVTLLEAARAAGMVVMSSGSLLQGRLARGLPEALRDLMPATTSDAQRALQIVRSVSGLSTALVGMKRREHVEENLGLRSQPLLPAERVLRILGGIRGG